MQSFYQELLPQAKGYYCLAVINPASNQATQTFVSANDPQQVETVAEIMRQRRTNVYLSPALLSEKTRSKETVLDRSIVLLDLDVKDNAFPDKRHALDTALEAFKQLKLKPCALVDSGGGIQFWIRFGAPMTREQRVLILDKLEAIDARLTTDRKVSVNPVALGRMPGSLNYKYDPPRQAKLLKLWPGAVTPAPSLKLPKAAPAVVPNPPVPLLGALQTAKTVFYVDADSVEQCAQVQWARANQASVHNDLWVLLLSLGRFVDDPEWVHQLSAAHPKYTRQETDNRTASLHHGPPLCKRFAELGAIEKARCDACPLQGSINTPANAPPRVASTSKSLALQADPAALLPKRYRLHHGSLQINQGDDGWQLVSGTPYWIERILRPAHGGDLLLEIGFQPAGQQRKTERVEARAMTNNMTRAKALGNINPFPSKLDLTYLQHASQHVLATQGETPLLTRMGWTNDMTAFAVPGKLFNKDGVTESAMESDRLQALVPEPSAGDWTTILRRLERDEDYLTLVHVLLSMAAPFIRFAPRLTAMVLHTHGETGLGKSVQQRLLESVWFNHKANVVPRNCTEGAFNKILGTLNGLPLCIDEVTSESSHTSIGGLFKLATGETRARLTASGEFRDQGERIQSLVFSSSNDTLQGLLEANQYVTDKNEAIMDAMNARMIEFRRTKAIRKPDQLMSIAERSAGQMGEHIAELVTQDVDNARDLFSNAMSTAEAVTTVVHKKTGVERTVLRMRESVYALALVSLRIATVRGWFSNNKRVLQGVVGEFAKEAQGCIKRKTSSAELWEAVLDGILETYQSRGVTTDPNTARVARCAPANGFNDDGIVYRFERFGGKPVVLVSAVMCREAFKRAGHKKFRVVLNNLMRAGVVSLPAQGVMLGKGLPYGAGLLPQRVWRWHLQVLAKMTGNSVISAPPVVAPQPSASPGAPAPVEAEDSACPPHQDPSLRPLPLETAESSEQDSGESQPASTSAGSSSLH